MRRAIELMADAGSFFEIGPLWGTDQVTGFVRFNGHPLGVIASDSRHVNGGAITADGCSKLTRHLDLCDLFHLPILNLVDNPGFAVGLEHEIAGTIRRGRRVDDRVRPGQRADLHRDHAAQLRRGRQQLRHAPVPRRPCGWRGRPPTSAASRPRAASRPPTSASWPRRPTPSRCGPSSTPASRAPAVPLGPLSKFQIEEMIDPPRHPALVCEWVDTAYRLVSQPTRLAPRALQFRP